jgi:WhiB family redox-sensing transcriptional regulator
MPERMTAYKVALPARTPWNEPGANALMALKPEPWTVDALCARTGGDAHYPEDGGSTAEAKAICAACDVRERCLQYALDNNEVHGVWGGLAPRERRHLRRHGTLRVKPEPQERELTPKHLARLALYQAGATTAQIADACGVRRSVIENWLRYYHLSANRG